MKQQNIKMITNSYRNINKAFDFILINLILVFLLSLQGFSETAVDLAVGLLFSVIFLLISEYLNIYDINSKFELPKYLSRLFLALLLSGVTLHVLKLRLKGMEGASISHFKIGRASCRERVLRLV